MKMLGPVTELLTQNPVIWEGSGSMRKVVGPLDDEERASYVTQQIRTAVCIRTCRNSSEKYGGRVHLNYRGLPPSHIGGWIACVST